MSCVLIPVKNLSNAKFRLSSVLNLEERHLLCLSMLSDVIRAVINVEQIKKIIVITSDEKIRAYTKKMGIISLNDKKNDLNLALEFGVKKSISGSNKKLLAIINIFESTIKNRHYLEYIENINLETFQLNEEDIVYIQSK